MCVHKTLINNAARRRVNEPTASFFNKETLVNSLIHHNNCDRRFRSLVFVELSDSIFKLWNLTVQHLVSLSIADTISVDDEVGREVAIV
jgi:hypothetical protein